MPLWKEIAITVALILPGGIIGVLSAYCLSYLFGKLLSWLLRR